MFLPALVISAGMAIYLAVNFRGLGNFVFFWLGVSLVFISSVILYRVTRNYILRRRLDNEISTVSGSDELAP